MKRAVLYLRVSTTDQTTANQERELRDVASRMGCRSLQDLVGFLSELHAPHIDLFLHQQGLDTTTPGGKAMFLPIESSVAKLAPHSTPTRQLKRLLDRPSRGLGTTRSGAPHLRALGFTPPWRRRAADALHRAGVNAKALGNAAYTLASALALVQSGKDALSPSIR